MIVVTGGDGFIGANLIERLKRDTDEEILSVDYTNRRRNENWCKPDDFLIVKDYFKRTKFIFHNGAISSTTASDPHEVMGNNFDYSVELLKRCMDKQIRMIYASSASVYGDGPFYEDTQSKPKNLYAMSKSMFDDYAMLFKGHVPQLAGLRYFNVYGKYEEHKGSMASVVYKFFNQHKNNGTISLFENSENYIRDFIHVDDVIDISMKFYQEGYSGIYNVGTGVSRSFMAIGKIFEQKLGSKIETIPMPTSLVGKYQRYTQAHNERINKVYPYRRIMLEAGVSKYIEYLESA